MGIQPDEPQARGDPASRNAIVGTLAAIPAAVTFLCGALARVFPAVRRGLLGAGVALLASSLVARLLVEVAG